MIKERGLKCLGMGGCGGGTPQLLEEECGRVSFLEPDTRVRVEGIVVNTPPKVAALDVDKVHSGKFRPHEGLPLRIPDQDGNLVFVIIPMSVLQESDLQLV